MNAFLSIVITIFALSSCTNRGTSKENRNISIDWSKIPITEVPCQFKAKEQTFTHDNCLIDKMIISDGAYGEGCRWDRLATYRANNIIDIIDRNKSERNKDEYTYSYKINEHGRLIRYFTDIPNIDNYKENSYNSLGGFYGYEFPPSKGSIRNHLKEGIWEENFTEYQLKMNEDDPTHLCGVTAYGNYHLGEKDGEWIYYYSSCDGIENLFRGEIYGNGVLIKSTYDSNDKEAFKYTIKQRKLCTMVMNN